MFEANDPKADRSERVIGLALRFVADRIGLANARTLEFSTRLILKAEVAALEGSVPDRHPAFRELGARVAPGAAAWNAALRAAAQAKFHYPDRIEFQLTSGQDLVLRTLTGTLDGHEIRERSLAQQLVDPEPWLEQLLPGNFLRPLLANCRATEAGSDPETGTAEACILDKPPVARLFGVPFMKGLGREVTAIHLCPFARHLASIRDGSELEVGNRLTREILDLGALANARMIAFRPRQAEAPAIELAIVGPRHRAEIARFDLHDRVVLPGLPLAVVTAIQYSGNGRFLAAGNGLGQVRVWHLAGAEPNLILDVRCGAQVESLAFHPHNHTVYAVLANGALAELELAPRLAPSVLAALRAKAPEARFKRAAAGLHGEYLYLSGSDASVHVVDTASGDVGVINPGVGPVLGLQVLPGSGYLCVFSEHEVCVGHAVGPCHGQQLGLVCHFDETIYAAWELDPNVVLVFHDLKGGGGAETDSDGQARRDVS